MRQWIISAIVLVFTVVVTAQVTRREVTNTSPTPADDLKPNSDQVPEAYAIEGKFDRVVVVRLKYQADLLAGIEKVIKEKNIRNAVILAAAGSVRNYQLHSVSNREFPSKNLFIENTQEPADIVSMNGYVIDGRVHAHMTLTNADRAFGGHLEPRTNVFTFAVVTLGVLNDGVDLSKVDDKSYR